MVVVRLLLAELARSAAYRHTARHEPALGYTTTANRDGAKAPVSAARAAYRAPVAAGPAPVIVAPAAGDEVELRTEGDLLVEAGPRPRAREVGRVAKVAWWRRLRSGTALVLLVALLGVATAAVVGAIALFFAFVLEQAIN